MAAVGKLYWSILIYINIELIILININQTFYFCLISAVTKLFSNLSVVQLSRRQNSIQSRLIPLPPPESRWPGRTRRSRSCRSGRRQTARTGRTPGVPSGWCSCAATSRKWRLCIGDKQSPKVKWTDVQIISDFVDCPINIYSLQASMQISNLSCY